MMSHVNYGRRFKMLPGEGKLLVQTDIHGNYEDFCRLRDIFFQLLREAPASHWVILGDVVHGPSRSAMEQNRALWGFEDESFRIVQEIRRFQEQYPEQIHFVLGNHEHAHVGGPRTRKFHDDETSYLESKLTKTQRQILRQFIEAALLCVATPCGAFLVHGAPGLVMEGREEIDAICFDDAKNSRRERLILKHFLRSYGQPRELAQLFLMSLNRFVEQRQNFVVHGHDADRAGFFVEGGNQICPTLFGAPRDKKRYLVLDLKTRYDSLDELIDEGCLRYLYPESI